MDSAPVPPVVGTAMVNTVLFLVGATPSRERTSENSGLLIIIPIALPVSIDDPPPMVIIKSAPEALYASTPCNTFSIVGLGLMSE